MTSPAMFAILADAVLALHFAYVCFVVGGLILIYSGGLLGWSWVRSRFFRLTHMLAIAVVVAQAWLGMVCPLTTLEMALKMRAGGEVYAGSFVGHWLQTLLYYQAAPWVFGLIYTLFGLMVAASWITVRPRPARRLHSQVINAEH